MPSTNGGERVGGESDRFRSNARGIGWAPSEWTMRGRDLHAARDPRRHRAELKRRRQHIALSDAGNQRFADLPGLLERRLLPIAIGDEPAAFAGNLDPRRLAEAEPARARLKRIDAELQRDLIEIAVAGVLDAQAQIHRAVAAPLPAMEEMRAEPVRARAGECRLGRDDAGIEGRERHHHLEGRARRIGARERLVDQRLVVVVGQIAPLFGRQTDIERVGVEARCRDERKNVAVFDIHDGASGAVVLQLLVDQALQLAVDRQVDVGSGRPLVAIDLANDAAIGVDLDAAGAGTAADRMSRRSVRCRACRPCSPGTSDSGSSAARVSAIAVLSSTDSGAT